MVSPIQRRCTTYMYGVERGASRDHHPPPVGVARRCVGDLHDLPGQQHRQRRDPGHPAGPRPVHLRPGVGGQRLHPGVRRPAAGRRPVRRRVRAAPAVPGRAGGVHRGVVRGRAGRVGRGAHRRPGRAGPRRRAGHADHAGDHQPRLPRPARAHRRGRHLGRRRRPGPRGRPAARRPALAARLLAVDLRDQRAGRAGHDGAGRLGDHASRGRPSASGSTCPAWSCRRSR